MPGVREVTITARLGEDADAAARGQRVPRLRVRGAATPGDRDRGAARARGSRSAFSIAPLLSAGDRGSSEPNWLARGSLQQNHDSLSRGGGGPGGRVLATVARHDDRWRRARPRGSARTRGGRAWSRHRRRRSRRSPAGADRPADRGASTRSDSAARVELAEVRARLGPEQQRAGRDQQPHRELHRIDALDQILARRSKSTSSASCVERRPRRERHERRAQRRARRRRVSASASLDVGARVALVEDRASTRVVERLDGADDERAAERASSASSARCVQDVLDLDGHVEA